VRAGHFARDLWRGRDFCTNDRPLPAAAARFDDQGLAYAYLEGVVRVSDDENIRSQLGEEGAEPSGRRVAQGSSLVGLSVARGS
jgi:hypothetical protein